MSYKTVLVHLNHAQRTPALMGAGIALARQFDAHLIGLYVFPAYRLSPPIPLPFGADVASAIRNTMKEDMERVRAAFEEAKAGQSLSMEWRSVTSQRRNPEAIVLEHARVADVIVANQADPDWTFTDILDFPEALAIDSGRPVYVVPNSARAVVPPRTVCVAWNGRREAARAVFDALPLLKSADKVYVLTVLEREPESEGALPDTEVGAALARHGINVEVTSVPVSGWSVGADLQARAVERGADLIVMGCYGHSRLREFALGGVTRHMLKDMTIPIMFSH
ncbi:MAG TPA: universal stress protein [Hyphomicrobiaceae bacterium]|nr:universal stress protein [Hyphomicrobiaceae bacterium]